MFITFEGIEGCGKSTQVGRLAARLKDRAVPFISTLEPGGTRIGGDVRRIVLDPGNRDLSPLSELLLYEADRAQHVAEVIVPALERGMWVLCDRFFDATTAYQGAARGQDMELVRFLNRKAAMGVVPDMTFLLDCPVEIGLARARRREDAVREPDRAGQDRFEREVRAFHEAVRRGYLDLAAGDSSRFVVVDGSMDEQALEAVIFEHVRPRIRA